ncbi:COX15/CtaA family protein [Stenotrophobium rhamnosiphilum]|uniref:Cytochrome B n=1 Tax=Stenotrophobium rhamnosiphilum TaxID=2029166 RepID=A0A2T5MGN0_9GAMM|nr:COX15/CtaA family protein [Stenotrophobium rhamnosiphilum]PTU31717.1 cytochrome B [Stenotrophobium rhamnosiphilum]
MLWFRRITSFALALCFVVIVVGAYVRLSDAGLGCPDWPGCYGHLGVPDAPHEVAHAEQQFAQPVEAHKAWKEMFHRYIASTLGALIVLLAVMSVFLRKQGVPRVLPWLLVGAVLMQGALGAFTVLWKVKPLTVSAHLLMGLMTLSMLLWLRLSLAFAKPEESPASADRELRNERHAWSAMQEKGSAVLSAVAPRGLRRFAALATVLVVLQIFLGGWTSSNYAALACPDFPTCHGSYLPETDIKEAFTMWRGLGVNYEGGVLDNRARVTIHYFHRVGALAVTITLLVLGAWLLLQKHPLWRRLGAVVIAALVLQVLLGITIVKLQLPLFLADMHNAGAALLLMTMVTLNFFVRRAEQQ